MSHIDRPGAFERCLNDLAGDLVGDDPDAFLADMFSKQSARGDVSGLLATIEGYLKSETAAGARLASEAIDIWRAATPHTPENIS